MKRSSSFSRSKTTRKSSALAFPKSDARAGARLPANKRPTLLGHDLDSELAYGFTKKERENHTHVIGSTGTGKSKFLELMIRQDVENRNCGMCLLDPHGKLYEDVLSYVATEKSNLADRIVTFNPFNDLDNIVGFNPIPSDQGRFDYIEENFISSCLKAWGQDDIHETPRITRWLQNIVHTLLMNDMTLLESAALISSERDNVMRHQMISNVVDERVRVEWQQFIECNLRDRNNLIEGAGNRLNSFLNNEIIRLVVGQSKNVLDLGKIMQEGKVLLINLHDEHGRVPHPSAKLLGTMIISELYRLIKLRDWRDPKLKYFYIYIDEFAQYVTKDIARTLEEVRKFKASFVLAHQHLSQLKREDEYLYSSVIGNCKNKVVFGGLSEEDSDLMNKEIQTGFIDLKTVKHTQMGTRERHIESRRLVRQEQFSETEGTSSQRSQSKTDSTTDTVSRGQGASESETQTQSRQKGSSHSVTQTEGTGATETHGTSEGTSSSIGKSENQSTSISHSDGKSETLGYNRSRSDGGSQAYSQGRTDGQTKSKALGKTQNQSASHAQSENWNSGSSFGSSDGFSDNRSHSTMNSSNRSQSFHGHDFDSFSDSRGSSEGSGSNYGHSNTHSNTSSNSSSQGGGATDTQTHGHGKSLTETQGATKSLSRSETKTTNFTDSQGSSENWGTNSSESQSKSRGTGSNSSQSESQQRSNSHSTNRTSSHGVTDGINESEGLSLGKSRGTNTSSSKAHSDGTASTRGTSDGKSQSVSRGYSEGYTPFLEPHEVVEEVSRQFWTREDLMYMKKAQMKNLPVAQAFVKIESNAPIHCQIANMPESRFSQRLSDDLIKRLQKKIVVKNPNTYLSLEQAQDNITERQFDKFQDVIRFYDTLRTERGNGDQTEDMNDDDIIDPDDLNQSKDYFGE